MLRTDTADNNLFRREVAGWLKDNLPDHLRHLTFRPEPAEIMPWYRSLAARGWIAPHWPRTYGGMEATPVQQVILAEEMTRAGAPDLPAQGLNHLGPILMKCGTKAQRERHLPAILNGDAIWCQGYSEPQAGSDLTSLRTRGRVEGSQLVIDGQKTWTTWGHHADWMFALVRTSDAPKPREGISFVLIDMATPGITRRPIRTIAGDDELCEVFFDGVRVPLSNVVGDLDGGWLVANALLDEERIRSGSPLLALKAFARLQQVVARAADATHIRERVAHAEIELETLTAAYLSVAERGGEIGSADSSYLKILGTETVQGILDILHDVAGESAALAHAERTVDGMFDPSEMFLQSRRLTIYGGTSEVQRNIIATRVLALPNSARAAK